MSSVAISLLDLEGQEIQCFEAEDYQTRVAKWCAGCGDFGALNAVKRLLAKEQLQPEKMALYQASAAPAVSLITSTPMASTASMAVRFP